ncbi:acyltransferase family protein [Microbacterium hominis]|uniref:Acyltransferase n=1 Tax=Microbacterium hominis TaxID=162426 RepID=A0A7D4QDN9_9MICO|nr:acyltransferase family protein [Microbacterium hominis]QKJ20357.1 acyltransferase [Microbacterium hominis]
MTSQTRSVSVRTDIQALRAVAVLLVVIYHLWPHRLPGGFVGVDVFFVISGFLITGHLLRELEATGGVRLASFWARRARRLIPASLLVLLATSIAVLVWVPAAYWRQFIGEVIASTFYVENWYLVAASTDYLAAENVPSPVQHFWSLSTEEQFYLLWPVMILGGAVLAKLLRRSSLAVVGWMLAVVVSAAFALSIALTAIDPSLAYFATPVRAWEFGAGGLLALLIQRRPLRGRIRTAGLAWLGWGAIALSAVVITGETPFPGAAAALPVAGTLAVLAADEPSARWAPSAALELAPVQRVGDWSYSIYLWHWPLIIIVPYALGAPSDWAVKILMLIATLLLAAGTYRWVESPLRRVKSGPLSRPRTALLGTAAAMAVVAMVAGGGATAATTLRTSSTEAAGVVIAAGEPCVGASAFKSEACEAAIAGRAVRPDVAKVLEDTGDAFDCYEYDKVADPETCTFGSSDPEAIRIALVGDSHAAMLIPGLRTVARERGWQISTWVGNGCVWRAPGTEPDECDARRAAVDAALREDPFDIILMTARRAPGMAASESAAAEALYVEAWQEQIDLGARILVLADNPRVDQVAFDCVLRSGQDAVEAQGCAVEQHAALAPRDILAEAAESSQLAQIIDLGDLYCVEGTCPLVAGDVMIYRDLHHITATYSREIAPVLAERLASLHPE